MNLDRIYLLTPNAIQLSGSLRLHPIEWQTITLISHNALINGAQLALKLQISPAGAEAVLSRLLELHLISEPEMSLQEYEAYLAQFAEIVPAEDDDDFPPDNETYDEEVPAEQSVSDSPVEQHEEHQPETEQHVEPVVEHQPETEQHVEPVVEHPPETEQHVEPVVEHPPETEQHVEPVVEHPPETEQHVEPVVEHKPETEQHVEPVIEHQPETEQHVEPVVEHPPVVEPHIDPVKPEADPILSESENPPPPPDESTGKTSVFGRLFGSKPKTNIDPTPVVKPKTGSVKLNYPILPVMDFVRKNSGEGLAGHLAVYKMFLNVPQQLLEYSAWTLIDIENSQAKTDNQNLALAFVQAAEKVVGLPAPAGVRI